MFLIYGFVFLIVSFVYAGEYTVHTIVKGVVEKVFVKEGDRVRKGEPLLRISPEIYDAEILKLENEVVEKEQNYLKIRKDFERYKELYERDLLAKSVYEDYEIRLKKAKAELEKTKAELRKLKLIASYTTVVSPYEGVVKKILVGEGSYVNGEVVPHPVVIIEAR